MNLLRKAAIAAIASSGLFLSGCGSYFRPVANVIPLPGGNPTVNDTMTVLNQNLMASQSGSFTFINVAGDTNVGNFPGQSSGVSFLNQNMTLPLTTPLVTFGGGNAVVATVNPGDGTPGSSSLAITTALTTIPVIVSLPTGSSPISVAATAGSSGLILVSLTGDTADCPPLGGAVGIIQASNSVLNSVVCMPSANPGFILVLPGDQKALVLDKIAGSATFIINIPSVTSATVSTTLTVGASPVWAATSVDGHTAYVLNQGSSSISVIDAVGESVTTLSVPTGGTSPSVIVADHIQNRLYVSNTASNNVSVFDASVTPIALLTSANPNPVPLNAGAHPIALAVSGSNIYVANTGLNFANIINANTLAVSAQTIKPIPLASASLVTWVAVSQDGTKAYVSAYDPVGGYPIADGTVIGPDAANTTVILSTSTNAVITDIPSPPQNMDPNTDACLANPTFDNCKAVAKQRPLQIVPRI